MFRISSINHPLKQRDTDPSDELNHQSNPFKLELNHTNLTFQKFFKHILLLSKTTDDILPYLIDIEKNEKFKNCLSLSQVEQKIWHNFFNKMIIHCRLIHPKNNPFFEIRNIVSKKSLSLILMEDRRAISLIHKLMFDNKYNNKFKFFAAHWLWIALFHLPLLESPIKIKAVNSLFSNLFKVDQENNNENNFIFEKFLSHDVSQETVKIKNQFQKIIDMFLIISHAIQLMQKQFDHIIFLSTEWLDKNKFNLFLLKHESLIWLHINIIISLVLNENADIHEITDYLDNVFFLFMKESFNNFSSQPFENWVYDRFIKLLTTIDTDRKLAVTTLISSINNIHGDNTLSGFEKVKKILLIAEIVMNDINAMPPFMLDFFAPTKNTLADELKIILESVTKKLASLQFYVCDHNELNDIHLSHRVD